MPLRSLLILGVSVLAAHLWLLGAATPPVQVRDRLIAPTFMTRSIAASVPPVAVPEAAPAPQKAAAPARLRAKAASPEATTARLSQPAAPNVVSPELLPVVNPLPAASFPASTHPSTHQPASASAAPAPPALRFSIPASVRLHYQVTATARHLRLQGGGELLWRHDGTSYDARLEISAPFLPPRIQHSTGLITAEGLAPVRFSDKARSEEAAHFQRDQGKVSFSGNRPDAPLLAGAQDRLSVMLQLGAMVGGDPQKFPAGTVISVQTASARDAEPWQFTVEGQEELELPGGKVGALKLIRNPRREFDQKVELWLAPGMDYVPVRLRLTQPNGDWVDQQWSSTDTR
jgi:hypothetical protein